MKNIKQWSAAAACAAALFITGCASTEDSRSTGQVLDDTVMLTKVKAALVDDPVVSGTSIDVDVERGVVMLNGAVNGEVAKQKAETIARGVDGVRSVQNNLVVRQAADTGTTRTTTTTTTPTTTSPTPDVDADVDADVDVDVK